MWLRSLQLLSSYNPSPISSCLPDSVTQLPTWVMDPMDDLTRTARRAEARDSLLTNVTRCHVQNRVLISCCDPEGIRAPRSSLLTQLSSGSSLLLSVTSAPPPSSLLLSVTSAPPPSSLSPQPRPLNMSESTCSTSCFILPFCPFSTMKKKTDTKPVPLNTRSASSGVHNLFYLFFLYFYRNIYWDWVSFTVFGPVI